MKSKEVKEKFIGLRAEGLSFSKISEKIKTSVPILMKWEKEYSREIDELKYLEFETLREKFLMGTKARLESYGEVLTKAKEELKSRGLKDVSSDKLLNMINDLENKFRDELKRISCHSEETTEGLDIDISKLIESPKHIWKLEDN